MLIPSCCPQCGTAVGHVAIIYKACREARVRHMLAESGIAVNQAMLSEATIDLSDVLQKLAIYNDCCRKTLTTALEFHDLY